MRKSQLRQLITWLIITPMIKCQEKRSVLVEVVTMYAKNTNRDSRGIVPLVLSQTSDYPAHRLVTILTELCQFQAFSVCITFMCMPCVVNWVRKKSYVVTVIAAWKQFLWQAEELQENQKHWKQKECISTLWSEKLCKGTKVSDNGTAGKTQPTKIRYNACVNICRVSGPLELSIVMI